MSDPQPLTERQSQVLEYIKAAKRDRGFPPTIREIGNALGIRSTNGVNDHLKALERKGYLTRSGSKSRAMMVLSDAEPSRSLTAMPESRRMSDAPPVVTVPLLGRIAAGVPMEAHEADAEPLQIDPTLLRVRGSDRVFALRVEGESMIEDGIFDGDIVFIREQRVAEMGQIAAVMVDGSATVKRVYHDGPSIRLEPANAAMSAIVVRPEDGSDVTILGKVVGVYRQI